WKASGYNDSSWSGPGPGLLFIEANAAVSPRNTPLPAPAAGGVMRTYYFRRHFNFSGSKSDLVCTFSNYLDDGAVWYLNGTEINRLRMPPPPAVIVNSTVATAQPCAGTIGANDATCPDVFDISATSLGSLVVGDNVLAVEVHNASQSDIVFGTGLIYNRGGVVIPELNMLTEADQVTLYWNAEGFTLQQTADLANPNS